MELEKLLLTKEELPIMYETCFVIPIHPRLLEPSVRIDKEIAHNVFPLVANEWYEDLSKYTETLTNEQTKSWYKEAFLKKKPKIEQNVGKIFRRQVLSTTPFWEDEVQTFEPTGFVNSISISRNFGGTLYFNPSDHDFGQSQSVNLATGSNFIRFSEEKLREFAKEIIESSKYGKVVVMDIYNKHNVDNYPGALFLRNWAVSYMNEVFKKHYKDLFPNSHP